MGSILKKLVILRGEVMYKIVKKETLNPDVELMIVKAPMISRNCQPGQFVIIRVEEEGERVPLTIADFDREEETVTIIYQTVGYSTKKLAAFEEGDSLVDILGPLGEPAPIEGYKKVLVIGGGVGIAPLYPQAKTLSENGTQVDVILGGRSGAHIIMKERFEKIAHKLGYATNDGSLGTEGFVTDVLKDYIQEEDYDLVIAIGPLIMMKAVVSITKEANIKTNVSLNPIMIDGTGMCGGCRVTVGGKTKFACVDGPDFNGFDVDFDEAMSRQGIYKDQEATHTCRMKAAAEKEEA
jgi:NAD(P)H-flavin reductase